MAEPMSAAEEARAWIERLAQYAREVNAENEANPIPEEMCPPTHVSAAVRLKPLPDGRVSIYEPGVEITPDRLWALLAEDAELRERAETAEAAVAQLLEEKAAAFVDATTMFKGLTIRDGQAHLEIQPAREMILIWCASVRAMLDEHQAKNYTETDIEMPRQNSVSLDIQDGQNPTDSYTLTLQRRYGKTPHQLREQAERERDEARAELAEMRERLAGERQRVADDIEAWAEGIGWYEDGGVWADAIDVARTGRRHAESDEPEGSDGG